MSEPQQNPTVLALKNAAVDLLQRIASYPVAAAIAVALCQVFRWAAAGTYPITQGPYSLGLSSLVGLTFFILIVKELNRNWFSIQAGQRWGFCALLFLYYLFFLAFIFVFRLLFTYVLPPFDPLIGCVAGLIVGVMFLRRWNFYTPRYEINPHVRGTERVERSPSQPVRVTSHVVNDQRDQPSIRWAGTNCPAKYSDLQFLVIGAMGSGKTLMCRDTMFSVLPLITANSGLGAVIFDLKQDLIFQLQQMGLHCPIIILNPLDARSVPWDIAGDLIEPGNMFQYACIFIPDSHRPTGDNDGFFLKAARVCLASAIEALNQIAPKRWTLRDLISLSTDPDKLNALLKSSPHTLDTLATFNDVAIAIQQRSMFRDITATIAAALFPLKPIAGIWEHTKIPPLNLKEWAQKGGSIVVFGNRFSHRESIMPINRVMFHRLSNLLLSRPETPGTWRTWVFIDELKEGGRLDGLEALATNGRSKGVRLVLAFQNIQGLRNVYGTQSADELIGAYGFTSFLRLSCPETAEWASRRIGDRERREINPTTNVAENLDKGHESTTRTSGTNEQTVNRRAVLPSELLNLPPVRDGRVTGFHILASDSVVAHGETQYPYIGHDSSEDYQERTNRDEFLPTPWTENDWKRLGIEPPKEQFPPPQRDPLDDLPPL